jgi:nicotinamide-nucleotide amidase
MFNEELIDATTRLLMEARINQVKFATAESCTGGLLGGLLTEIPGSSDVYERGFITYSNLAKHELLGVSAETLSFYGAVSPQTANAMANGALKNSAADIAVSITGVAGPGGGSMDKPVGLVYFGLARKGSLTRTFEQNFGDVGRDEIRMNAVTYAIGLFFKAMQ